MVGVYIDVTDRMRVERALLERDAQLDLANQVGRVGGYSYDHATNTLRLGAGTAAIYGLPESTEEMTAEEWRKCVHTEDLKQLAAELINQYLVTYTRPETLIPPDKMEVTVTKPGLTARAPNRTALAGGKQ